MLDRRILAAVYSLTVALGVLTLLFPAPSIEGVIGYAFAYIYGFLLVVGGLIALAAVILPNYKIEYVALWFVAGGYGVYAAALWGLFAERLGIVDGLPPPYGPAIALTVLTLFLIAKAWFLARKNRELIRASENGMD